MNAKQELLNHIKDRKVKHIHISYGDNWREEENNQIFAGSLAQVVDLLDFEYDSGYGLQHLFGHIWYEDGSWSERGEYDGSEWWEHKYCPPIPLTPEQRSHLIERGHRALDAVKHCQDKMPHQSRILDKVMRDTPPAKWSVEQVEEAENIAASMNEYQPET